MKSLCFLISFALINATVMAQELMNTFEAPVIANFNGLHCDGKHGLCSLNSAKEQSSNAILIFDSNHSILLLQIDRSKVSDEDTNRLFGRSMERALMLKSLTIEIGNQIDLTSNLRQQLHIDDTSFSISDGFSPVTITDTHIIILLGSK